MSDIARAFIEEARSQLAADYLPKIERCLEGLSDAQIWWRPNEQSNSIGNLLLHLAGNARQWIVCGVGGASDRREREREFNQRDEIPRDALLAALRATLAEVDETLASVDPNSLLEERRIQGLDVSLLRAIFHVVEHFSMHTGQIIQLTKLLKGDDLAFYNFKAGMPRANWNKSSDG